MENLAFHSLLRGKMIIIPISCHLNLHIFSLKRWENVLFELGSPSEMVTSSIFVCKCQPGTRWQRKGVPWPSGSSDREILTWSQYSAPLCELWIEPGVPIPSFRARPFSHILIILPASQSDHYQSWTLCLRDRRSLKALVRGIRPAWTFNPVLSNTSHLLWRRVSVRNVSSCLPHGIHYPHQHSVDTPVCLSNTIWNTFKQFKYNLEYFQSSRNAPVVYTFGLQGDFQWPQPLPLIYN